MVFADVLHVALTRLTHPYPHDPLVAASPPPPPRPLYYPPRLELRGSSFPLS